MDIECDLSMKYVANWRHLPEANFLVNIPTCKEMAIKGKVILG